MSARVGHDDEKLLATVAARNVALAHHVVECRGEVYEYFIAEAMTETVAARERNKPLKQNQMDYFETVLALLRRSSVSETEIQKAQLNFENARIEANQVDFELKSSRAMHAATTMMPDSIYRTGWARFPPSQTRRR